MTDHDSRLQMLVNAALAGEERGRDIPEFKDLWARARESAPSRVHTSAWPSQVWTAATAAAVLLAIGIGIHGLYETRTGGAATEALMAELARNVSWQAPSDRLSGLDDRRFVAELPDIPMVDTSLEGWDL